MDPIEDLRKHYGQHVTHAKFVNLRKRFITDQEEHIFHEIQLLKSERKLIELLEPNLALALTDEDPNIRQMVSTFKNGAVTGQVISKQIDWEDLYNYIDDKLSILEDKHDIVEQKRKELQAYL